MSSRIVDARGQILSAPSKQNIESSVIIKILGDNESRQITVPFSIFNQVFYTEELEKNGYLRYNKDGDKVLLGDYVFVKLEGSYPSEATVSANNKVLSVIKDQSSRVLEEFPVSLIDDSLIEDAQSIFATPYSLTIGTATFYIPPSFIEVTRINTGDKVPLLRSKGSIKRNAGRSDTQIKIDLFFSGTESINDDENGLRALVAMFERTPFVPIKNGYLNFVHDIDAVCLHDISITTLSGLPDTVLVQLTLFKFNYNVYLPDATRLRIDEKLFKWYYKRGLTTGKSPLLKPISENRTSLLDFLHVPEYETQSVQRNKILSPGGSLTTKAIEDNKIYDSAFKDSLLINEVREIYEEMSSNEKLQIKRTDRILAVKNTYEHLISEIDYDLDRKKFKILFIVQFDHSLNTGGEAPFTGNNPKWKPIKPSYWPISGKIGIFATDLVSNSFTPKSLELMNKVDTNLEEAWLQLERTQRIVNDTFLNESHLEELMQSWPGLEDVIITEVKTSKRNLFSRAPILSHDAPAYQYLGSQDNYVNLTLEVLSDKGAASLSALFDYCNRQARNYNLELTSGFLKINNDIVNLLGIYHVLIESMVFETVQGFPGRNMVSLSLVDFNVVQSYYEKGYEIAKEGDYYVFRKPGDKLKRVLEVAKATADLNTRDHLYEWQQVLKLMKNVNLYPDLDLPTYDEVYKETGVKLPNPHNSIYVEPDFYIIGSFPISSELAKIIEGDLEVSIKDFLGEQVSKIFRNGDSTVVDQEYDPSAIEEFKKKYLLPEEDYPINETETKELVNLIKEQVSAINSDYRTVYNEHPLPRWVAYSLAYLQGEMRLYNENKSLYSTSNAYGPMQIDKEFFTVAKNKGLSKEWIYANVCPDGFTQKELNTSAEKNIKFGLQLLVKKHAQDVENIHTFSSVETSILKNKYIARLRELLSSNEFMWVISLIRYKESPYPTPASKISVSNIDILAKSIYDSVLIGKYVYNEENRNALNQEESHFLNSYDVFIKARKETYEDKNYYDDKSFGESIKSDANEWYDTMRYSRRGSMLRAFPTFQVLLLDEGKWIYWGKMWDDFYGVSSVSQISVNRSRKRVADTCSMVLTNMYKNFHDNSSIKDSQPKYKINVLQYLRPTVRNEEMEKARAYSMGSIHLQAGARIHLRMGYGNNLEELPILFNGCITEVSVGEVVNIIAQGDGIELTQVLDFEEGETFGRFGLGLEPRNTFSRILLGGDSKRNSFTTAYPGQSKLFGGKNSNPVVHFGDPSFYGNVQMPGEMLLNIYPGNTSGEPEWEGLLGWFTNDEINLSIDLHQKSIWDIAQVMSAAIPNYIVAVHPFDFRSTLFYGKPFWDLAYGYEVSKKKPPEGEWNKFGNYYVKQKKKPYAQWHCYTSFEDIVSNEIKATSDGLFTNVVATYKYTPVSFEKEAVGQVVAYADRSIDPEHQRTVTIDSEIYSKGPLSFLQKFLPLSWIPGLLGAPRRYCVEEHTARNIAVANVIDYLKDMYQGSLLVLGDPTVKPFDYMYIGDAVNDMLGTTMVKEVTHYMDIETGFVTSIQPDCCVATDNQKETNRWIAGGAIGASLFSGIAKSFVLTALAGMAAKFSTIGAFLGSSGAFATAIATTLGTVGATIAGIPILGVIAGVAVVCIVAKSIDEVLKRIYHQSQSVVINTLVYQGREFSAGINGHNGITIGTTSGNKDSLNRFLAVFPDWLTKEIDPRDPKIMFGKYHHNYRDDISKLEYLIGKYGDEVEIEDVDPEYLETTSRALQSSSNPWINTALKMIKDTSYESGTDESYLTSLEFIKNLFSEHGYSLSHRTIPELYADRVNFANADAAKEEKVGIGNRVAKTTFLNTYTIPDEAKVGDLVFFDLLKQNSPSFVGVITYIKDGNFDFISMIPYEVDSGESIQVRRVNVLNSDESPFKGKVFGVTRPLESVLSRRE